MRLSEKFKGNSYDLVECFNVIINRCVIKFKLLEIVMKKEFLQSPEAEQKPEAVIAYSLDNLGGEIEYLKENIGILLNKLKPVLTPVYTDSIKPSTNTTPAACSPIYESITFYRSEVVSIQALVDEIFQRLEI